MNKYILNLTKINPYEFLTGEEYVTLALFNFYFYKKTCNVEVFSEEIILYEELIELYNNFIKEDQKKSMFLSYILEIGEKNIKTYINKYDKEPWKYSKPVIWKDRRKRKYYIDKLTESHRFEIYVDYMFKQNNFDIGIYYQKEDQYIGESNAGIEIKYDNESLKTHNLYIEYKERLHSEGSWIDSGILKQDNTIYWAIGNYKEIFFIKKSVLIDIMNRKYPGIKVKDVCAKRKTSKGYIISISDAKSISESIETVIRNIQLFN